jgi:hypothetical protein
MFAEDDDYGAAVSLGATDQLEWTISAPGFYWVRTRFINVVSAVPETVEVDVADIAFLPGLDLGDLATRDTVALGAGGQVVREDGSSHATDANTITSLGTAAAIISQGGLATLNQVNLGLNVNRSGGGALILDADAITALGTAAAIASQGALATLSQLAMGAAGRLYREDGTTRLTDLLAITTLGTAAAIASQGALATLSQVAIGASGRVYRDDGTTRLTDALAITALGTAAAIASQGALATLSQVALGASGRVYRDDGSTRLTDALAVTALGTAAAISGQGAFATVSTAAYGSGLLTGFGTLAARATVRFGTEVYRADGTTVSSDSMVVTSLGTASAIAGQGAFATVSTAAYGSGLLTGFGTLAARATVRIATEVYRADGTTVTTEVMVVTSLGTASAIASQGALATLSAAAWGSQVSGRPVELTDGRVGAGLTAADGYLQTGLYGGASTLSISQLINATNGTQIGPNPEFQGGVSTGYVLYNNAGGTKVSQAIVADTSAPNGSGYILRISYDGTGVPNVNPAPSSAAPIRISPSPRRASPTRATTQKARRSSSGCGPRFRSAAG